MTSEQCWQIIEKRLTLQGAASWSLSQLFSTQKTTLGKRRARWNRSRGFRNLQRVKHSGDVRRAAPLSNKEVIKNFFACFGSKKRVHKTWRISSTCGDNCRNREPNFLKGQWRSLNRSSSMLGEKITWRQRDWWLETELGSSLFKKIVIAKKII